MKEIHALRERAKELRCLYAVDAIVGDRAQSLASAFRRVLEEIPAGWQHPDTTGACIVYFGRNSVGRGFDALAPSISEPIPLWGVEVGRITVSNTNEAVADRPFLPEETELLRRIAARLGEHLEWKQTQLLGERTPPAANHWAWRQRFAEALADSLDGQRFGVSRLYLGGSTARGDARPASDIDLYVRCHGSASQREELTLWLEGWSYCLAAVALQHTGQPFPHGILNVQWLDSAPGPWQRSELQELKLGGAPRDA